MKYLFITIIFLINYNLFSSELSCIFEEVHQNGDIEQGVFIAKDNKFRYQYFSQNLLTIIYKDKLFVYLQNSDTTKYFKLDNNTHALEAVVKIISDFPNIHKEYYINETLIRVEISKVSKFPKRIIVLSENLNMSIYVNECKTIVLDDKYFLFSPFWDYKY